LLVVCHSSNNILQYVAADRSVLPSFSIAHLSDLHLPMGGLRLEKRRWLSKRTLSHLSWQVGRRRRHRPEVLAALIDDVSKAGPSHIAITGDVTNTGRPEEFERSLPWLRRLGSPSEVSLVPGNHDALVPLPYAQGQALWRDWMADDASGAGAFPFVRRRGPAALVGLNTAVSTPIFRATGLVGDDQLARLEATLDRLGQEGLFRIVLLHHPVVGGLQAARKALTDRAGLQAVLRRSGAELILHGHTHKASLTAVPGRMGPIAAVGVPSASGIAGREAYAARWNLYQIEERARGWQVKVTARRLAPDGLFHDIGRFTVTIPRGEAKVAVQ